MREIQPSSTSSSTGLRNGSGWCRPAIEMSPENHLQYQYQRMLLGLALLGNMACSAAIPAGGSDEIAAAAILYSVSAYDPARDPQKDLEATRERALAEGKRILLEVGGEWCTWCKALDRYVHENEAVASALEQDFLIMKVNYSEENPNTDFLSPYPSIPGYPHIFVLDRDGSFLHSQGTGELEQGRWYNQEAFLAFLGKWAPPS